ncbi:MAG: sialidase family protein [Bacteroidota bacterium]
MTYASNFLVALIALLNLGLLSCAQSPDPDPAEDSIRIRPLTGNFPQALALSPTADNGVYDATVASDPQSGRVWMIYSGVELIQGSSRISTHLAYSEDGGASWIYTGLVNASEALAPEDYPAEFSEAQAVFWQHEVPSITYDPDAPANERWRILWHRYLQVDDGIPSNEDRQFAYGWIGSKSAATPEGLLRAEEQKLFSTLAYHLNPSIEAFNNSILGLPQVRLDGLDPELSGTLVFSEPGMLAYQGDLYVSLLRRDMSEAKIVLIKFNQVRQSWEYVASLLDNQDARALNPSWNSFSASDLFLIDRQAFILVSPVVNLYEGVLLLAFDPIRGQVRRDEEGLPDILYSLEKTPGAIQTGVATYDEGLTATGMLFGDAFMGLPQFRMFASGIQIQH